MGGHRPGARRGAEPSLRAGRGDQPQGQSGDALPGWDQPAHRRAQRQLLRRLLRRRRAPAGRFRPRRSCRTRCSPRPTCPTSRPWCRSSTWSRLSAPRGRADRRAPAAGWSSRASTSTSGSSPRCRATTTRTPCASCSARASSTGSPGSRRRSTSGSPTSSCSSTGASRERSREELKEVLKSAGGIFDRLHREMKENNLDIYKAGPWNAGLEPFPRKFGARKR